MIVDVTRPNQPIEKFHIPGPGRRRPDAVGAHVPRLRPSRGGAAGRVYLMRNVQGSAASGYEVWDVTNVSNPFMVGAMRGLSNTHKHYWECQTGIAYLPGSVPVKLAPAAIDDDRRLGQPGEPVYLRTHGLPGSQPTGTGPVPPSLHGASPAATTRTRRAGWRAAATQWTSSAIASTRVGRRRRRHHAGARQEQAVAATVRNLHGRPEQPDQRAAEIRRRRRSSTCRRTRGATPACR